jgi:alpha-ketoglutarate-dependent taurine dioxygenase
MNDNDNRDNIIYIDNIINNNIEKIGLLIKDKLINQRYSYIIIRNNNNMNNVTEIMNFYSAINEIIGKIQIIDKEKYNDELDDYWVNIEYKNDNENDSTKPWKTNKNLSLHTDNTLTNDINFSNITELVCIEPSKYSGETTFISNNKIIEIVRYMDTINNTKLFEDVMNTKIYHKNIQKDICRFDDNTKEYIINFNITQILKSTLNDKKSVEIAMKFATILENIMNSSIVDVIRLNKGDAIFFNDTMLMHGRKFIFGNRLYKKCSLLI